MVSHASLRDECRSNTLAFTCRPVFYEDVVLYIDVFIISLVSSSMSNLGPIFIALYVVRVFELRGPRFILALVDL